MNTHQSTAPDRRGLRRRVVVGSAVASSAIAIALGLSGAASADSPPITLPPGVTLFPTPPPVTLPPGVTLFPTTPPHVTLPPGVTLFPTTPTTPATGDTGTPGTTGTAGTTGTPDAGDPANTDVAAPGSDPAAGPVDPFLEITSAAIDCAGLVHLEYKTGANPEPAATTEHVVVISPVADPATLVTQRLTEQATNGQFVLDVPASLAPQHVVVVADFEAANAAGIILVDEAEVVPADDCQVTTG